MSLRFKSIKSRYIDRLKALIILITSIVKVVRETSILKNLLRFFWEIQTVTGRLVHRRVPLIPASICNASSTPQGSVWTSWRKKKSHLLAQWISTRSCWSCLDWGANVKTTLIKEAARFRAPLWFYLLSLQSSSQSFLVDIRIRMKDQSGIIGEILEGEPDILNTILLLTSWTRWVRNHQHIDTYNG
jgi:hypothetical protein